MRRSRVNLPDRCYHLISRIANRAFFLNDEEEKNRFAELLMLPDKPKSRFQRYALA